jgi:hypothetical protein
MDAAPCTPPWPVGAEVSVTVRMNAQIRAAIAAIDDQAWTTI